MGVNRGFSGEKAVQKHLKNTKKIRPESVKTNNLQVLKF